MSISSYSRARILLLSASVLCFTAFWWTGKLFSLPVHPGFEASLLQQPSPAIAVLIVTILLAACTLFGTALSGMVRFNGGLVAAVLGLSALSFRGGTSRRAIFWGLLQSDPSAIFRKFAYETTILTALIFACWWVVRSLYDAGTLKDREGAPDSLDNAHSIANDIGGVSIQLVVTAVALWFLAANEAKQQVLAAIFVASFLGSLSAQSVFPTGPRGWYWIAPLLIGIIGFAAAAQNPQGAITADLDGYLAPLARPLPLDYASAGPAGAIIGHWMSRRWARERKAELLASTQPKPA